jgi:hypothetical protein
MEEQEIRTALQSMEQDHALITNSAYRANGELWADNKMPFVEVHLAYLKAHAALDPRIYLSNLRLRIRSNPRIR